MTVALGHGGAAAEPAAAAAAREATASPRGYAGIVTRTIAFAIDAAVIDAVAAVVGATVLLILSVLAVDHQARTVLAAIGGVAFVIWWVAYFVTFWTATGQTPGNRVMRIRVVRDDGTRRRPRHALLRLIGMVVGLPLLWGYVPILFNDRRRALHDAMAGTVVVLSAGAQGDPDESA